MLDGLDAIDWARLRHAFGPADDVPGLLRDAAADDPARRRRALEELHATIWHQGTVYEATAHAVPFLAELAARAGAPDRTAILQLLGLVAQGQSYHAVHAPSARADVERETAWVRAARAAVLAALPAVLALLRDPDAAIRRFAAFVAACLPEAAEASRPAVRAALGSATGPEERAVLGLALAILGELAPAAIPAPSVLGVPSRRLEALEQLTAGGAFPPEDALWVLCDLAGGTCDPTQLDHLGAP